MTVIDPSRILSLGYANDNELDSELEAIASDLAVAYENAGMDLARLAEYDDNVVIEWSYTPCDKD